VVADLVVTLEGFAHLLDAVTPARRDAYLSKYDAGIVRLGTDALRFLEDFSTPIEVVPSRVRLFISE